MAFTSEVLAQRTSTGERRTVKEQGSLGSPHVNTVGSLIHTSCTLCLNFPVHCGRVQMSCVCEVRLPGLCGDSRQ